MLYTKDNPLRVCTVCSGYDSQCLALNRLKKFHIFRKMFIETEQPDNSTTPVQLNLF